MSKFGEDLIRAMSEALAHAKDEGPAMREESKAWKRIECEDAELKGALREAESVRLRAAGRPQCKSKLSFQHLKGEK